MEGVNANTPMSRLSEEMMEYVGFGEDEIQALHSLRPVVEREVDRIVEDFYDRVEANPRTRGIVAAHSSRKRLSGTLREWVLDIVRGRFDDAYFERRRRIGQKHVEIGLPPHYVFTAMNVLRESLSPLANEDQKAALDKLMDIELGIINQVYWDDITEELQRKERLATIGELSGSLAHEIRNPLGAIQNAAYFVRRRVGDQDPKATKHLDILDRTVEECSWLVESMLEFARDRAPVPAPVNAARLLANALTDVALPTEIAVESCVPEGFELHGDAIQLRAVLRNLLKNAAQAILGASSTGQIRVEVIEEAEKVRVLVSDDGPGVSEDIAEKIFQPLVTTKTYGLGLGLAYCRRVAEAHKGRLFLAPREGTGATFVLELPT